MASANTISDLGGTFGLKSEQSASNSSWGWNSTDATAQRIYNEEQAKIARDFAAAEAQKDRDWQEMMSSTAYRRAVEDMKAAGLNPILAALNGGAQFGSGATARSIAATSNADSSGASGSSGESSAKSYDNLIMGLAAAFGMLADSVTGALAGSKQGGQTNGGGVGRSKVLTNSFTQNFTDKNRAYLGEKYNHPTANKRRGR